MSRCSINSFDICVLRRRSEPLYYLIQRAHHTRTGQRQIDINGQAFSVVVIDDIEGSELPTIEKRVAHKVHRPHLVRRRGHIKWVWFVALEPLTRLDAQVQLKPAVDPLDALVVPAVALHVAQIKET